MNEFELVKKVAKGCREILTIFSGLIFYEEEEIQSLEELISWKILHDPFIQIL